MVKTGLAIGQTRPILISNWSLRRCPECTAGTYAPLTIAEPNDEILFALLFHSFNRLYQGWDKNLGQVVLYERQNVLFSRLCD